ncbi:calcium-binding protein [Pseudomonas oryzihabitans]|uniref:calcium-binding protein n=1 Tax=Pseudomonas oryzihabitans TaxID=47885 RepID=UPI002554F68A|nr:calcium-binding protein [Pseudomonas oryzihabitans]MDK8264857.1 calcium-binding protein [Pseudomonas oryzihabitans]
MAVPTLIQQTAEHIADTTSGTVAAANAARDIQSTNSDLGSISNAAASALSAALAIARQAGLSATAGALSGALGLFNDARSGNGITDKSLIGALGALAGGIAALPAVTGASLVALTAASIALGLYGLAKNDKDRAVHEAVVDMFDRIKAAQRKFEGVVSVREIVDGIDSPLLWSYPDYYDGDGDGVYIDIPPEVKDSLRDGFEDAEKARSPIILDLDGDGVETIGKHMYFDNDANGFAERSGWVGKDDGLLVWDRNGNGRIDNGSELFGNSTDLPDGKKSANGFIALQSLDSNSDGVISKDDQIFQSLRVWRDANSDGVVQEGELLELDTLGIASIRTGYIEPGKLDANGDVPPAVVDENGNEHRQVGAYVRSDGSTGAAVDVWFTVDGHDTKALSHMEESDLIKSMPQINGFGNVYSLRQAMMRDGSGALFSAVQAFSQSNSIGERKALVVEILYRWAGVYNVNPGSRAAGQIYGNVIGDARKLAVLEAFLGDSYLGTWCWGERDPNPHGVAAPMLLQSFDNFAGAVYSKLMMQTHLANIFGELTFELGPDGLSFNIDSVIGKLKSVYNGDANYLSVIREFADTLGYSGSFGAVLLTEVREAGERVGGEFGNILSGIGNLKNFGSDDPDFISGSNVDDYLIGAGGDDRIYGRSGDDRINGGIGDDYLIGGDGADIYEYNRGDGNDTIFNGDQDKEGIKLDVLQFGSNVKMEDLVFSRKHYDLIIYFKGYSGSILIQSYFDEESVANNGYAVEKLAFSDGKFYTYSDVLQIVSTPSENDDTIWGSFESNMLYGLSGDDTLYGELGDDVLAGGQGNDRLYGGGGNDLINGGVGDDFLVGGSGSDTYGYSYGDGNDTISNLEQGEDGARLDSVSFGSDINIESVVFVRNYNDLRIGFKDTSGGILIQGYFDEKTPSNNGSAVEKIIFSTGAIITYKDVLKIVSTPTESGDYLWGGIEDDTFYGLGGDDNIYGQVGDDVLDGGKGSDKLLGGIGNDYLAGGEGDDWLDGEDGDDVLAGGAGNDRLIGGKGADTFIFGVGGGQDIIDSNGYYGNGPGNVDKISLQDVAMDQVTISRKKDDLVISLKATGDSLNVMSYFYNYDVFSSVYGVGQVLFADGSVLTRADIASVVQKATDGNDNIIGYSIADNLDGGDGDDRVLGNAGDDSLNGGNGNDYLDGGDGADVVYGGAGNDTLIAGSGNNRLYGGDGSDYLISGVGVNILDGGAGNDVIQGGDGSDTYLYRRGSGNDTIRNSTSYYARYPSYDVIVLEGLKSSDVTVTQETQNLKIVIIDTGECLYVESFFYLDGISAFEYSIDKIIFGDGEAWDLAKIKEVAVQGTVNSDTIIGYSTADYLRGFDGDDQINGNDGDDIILGDEGRDVLHGGAGADSLQGGRGNDILYGGSGSDLYLFERGDGQDITDSQDDANAVDTLRFGQGIEEKDILAVRHDKNLYLRVNGTTDQVGFNNFYSESYFYNGYMLDSKIDRVEFSNGVVWSAEKIGEIAGSALVNSAPTVSKSIVPAFATIGTGFSYTIDGNTFSDLDSLDQVSYLLRMADGSSVPSWLSYDPSTRTLSGTPSSTNKGKLLFSVVGEDMFGGSTITSFELNVVSVNQAPKLSSMLADQRVAEGSVLNYTLPSSSFTDPDSGDALTYSATLADGTGLPTWLNFNASTRQFIGTAPINGGGSTSVKVIAKDKSGLTASDVFDIVISVQNITLTGTSGSDTLTGRSGNDTLSGGAGIDTLIGNAGNDRLDGGAGNDVMRGGLGDDTYIVDSASDLVAENVGEGSDTVESSVTLTLGANLENLTLTGANAINGNGNASDNVLFGNSAANTLTGGAGNDRLDGKSGADKLVGGTGNDTFVVDNTGDAITENASEGIDTVESSITWTLGNNLENLTLTGAGAVSGTGNGLDNVLVGNGAANTLTGGAGNDRLDGVGGADKLLGGAGNDVYVVDNISDIITENANEGTDTVESSISWTLGSNIEHLTLTGSAASNGTGNTSANVLIGNLGDNTLSGGVGNDTLDGKGGIDTLVGGVGNDIYVLGRGYGMDTVVESDKTSGNIDIASFLSGIGIDQLWFRQVAGTNSLEVSIIGSSDALLIKDWYSGSAAHVEQFKTSDGKTLFDSKVQNLVNAMASFAPPAAGQLTLPDQYKDQLTTVIAANWQ